MEVKIKSKEATAIINSLSSGVVPNIGIQHITVGRKLETEAITNILRDVGEGHSIMKFWIGDYGSGKSFMLHLLNTIALKHKFVVTKADFTPDVRLYSNDGKAVALYRSIMDNISIQTKPEGGALSTLLDKWIESIVLKTAQSNNIPITEIRDEKYSTLIQDNIMFTVNEVTTTGSFDFGIVINKYYEGFINNDDLLKRSALKWLKGEYRTRTEARQDLGVREIINDWNFYDMLKNFCSLFVSIGYSGFIINLDEAVNLYKLSQSTTRAKNYEKLLSIYNDCYQGRISNMFINIAGTREFLENERKGLFSYDALKTRLASNKYETLEIRDFTQPVLKLLPLNHNEIFVLLEKLRKIFNLNYNISIDITDEDIRLFMEEMFNKPGADEFLTPREVIREFLNILSILRQNPNVDKSDLISQIEIEDERPDYNEIIEEI